MRAFLSSLFQHFHDLEMYSTSSIVILLLLLGSVYAPPPGGGAGLGGGAGGGGAILIEPVALELLLSGCGVCGVLDYPESLMFAVREDPAEEFKIILVYKEIAEGSESRTPVEDAAVIVHVKDTGELYRVYTDENGEARYSYAPYTDECYDFDFIYCHAPADCGFNECLLGAGLTQDRIDALGYDNICDVPLESGESTTCPRVSAPVAVQPVTASGNYCPPPPAPGGVAIPPFCFPLLLLFALMGGSLYLSGRNPFAGFDFSTPRMHKPFQYTARSLGMSFSAAAIAQAVSTVKDAVKGGKKGAGEAGPKAGLFGKLAAALKGAEKEVKKEGEGKSGIVILPGGQVKMVGGGGKKGSKDKKGMGVAEATKGKQVSERAYAPAWWGGGMKQGLGILAAALPFTQRAAEAAKGGAPVSRLLIFALGDLVRMSSLGTFFRAFTVIVPAATAIVTLGKVGYLKMEAGMQDMDEKVMKWLSGFGFFAAVAVQSKHEGPAKGMEVNTEEGKVGVRFDKEKGWLQYTIAADGTKGPEKSVDDKSPKEVQALIKGYTVEGAFGMPAAVYWDPKANDGKGGTVAYQINPEGGGKSIKDLELPPTADGKVFILNYDEQKGAFVYTPKEGGEARVVDDKAPAIVKDTIKGFEQPVKSIDFTLAGVPQGVMDRVKSMGRESAEANYVITTDGRPKLQELHGQVGEAYRESAEAGKAIDKASGAVEGRTAEAGWMDHAEVRSHAETRLQDPTLEPAMRGAYETLTGKGLEGSSPEQARTRQLEAIGTILGNSREAGVVNALFQNPLTPRLRDAVEAGLGGAVPNAEALRKRVDGQAEGLSQAVQARENATAHYETRTVELAKTLQAYDSMRQVVQGAELMAMRMTMMNNKVEGQTILGKEDLEALNSSMRHLSEASATAGSSALLAELDPELVKKNGVRSKETLAALEEFIGVNMGINPRTGQIEIREREPGTPPHEEFVSFGKFMEKKAEMAELRGGPEARQRAEEAGKGALPDMMRGSGEPLAVAEQGATKLALYNAGFGENHMQMMDQIDPRALRDIRVQVETIGAQVEGLKRGTTIDPENLINERTLLAKALEGMTGREAASTQGEGVLGTKEIRSVGAHDERTEALLRRTVDMFVYSPALRADAPEGVKVAALKALDAASTAAVLSLSDSPAAHAALVEIIGWKVDRWDRQDVADLKKDIEAYRKEQDPAARDRILGRLEGQAVVFPDQAAGFREDFVRIAGKEGVPAADAVAVLQDRWGRVPEGEIGTFRKEMEAYYKAPEGSAAREKIAERIENFGNNTIRVADNALRSEGALTMETSLEYRYRAERGLGLPRDVEERREYIPKLEATYMGIISPEPPKPGAPHEEVRAYEQAVRTAEQQRTDPQIQEDYGRMLRAGATVGELATPRTPESTSGPAPFIGTGVEVAEVDKAAAERATARIDKGMRRYQATTDPTEREVIVRETLIAADDIQRRAGVLTPERSLVEGYRREIGEAPPLTRPAAAEVAGGPPGGEPPPAPPPAAPPPTAPPPETPAPRVRLERGPIEVQPAGGEPPPSAPQASTAAEREAALGGLAALRERLRKKRGEEGTA